MVYSYGSFLYEGLGGFLGVAWNTLLVRRSACLAEACLCYMPERTSGS